jgi:hypothetical protein
MKELENKFKHKQHKAEDDETVYNLPLNKDFVMYLFVTSKSMRILSQTTYRLYSWRTEKKIHRSHLELIFRTKPRTWRHELANLSPEN